MKSCITKQISNKNPIRCPTCRIDLGSPSSWVKGQTGIIKMFREVRLLKVQFYFTKQKIGHQNNKIKDLENEIKTQNQQIEDLQKELDSMDVICLN